MSKQLLAIGIGSNKNPLSHFRMALSELKKVSDFTVLKVSQIYESKAILPELAPITWDLPYLNAVVLIEVVNFEPIRVLQILKTIEKNMGRVPSAPWSPREIDLDILYGPGLNFKSETLVIPHSQITERPFVYYPLIEVLPELKFELKNNWAKNSEIDLQTKKSQMQTWASVAGIVNLTSDSFSDGGMHEMNQQDLFYKSLTTQISQFIDEGAEVVDIGAESTRPGSVLVDDQIEFDRLNKALKIIYDTGLNKKIKISVDTKKFDVAQKILNLFEIDFLNDVSGCKDQRFLQLIKTNKKLKYICMHSLSVPPQPGLTIDPEENIFEYLITWWRNQLNMFENSQINLNQIIFDVGIGFGKTVQQNINLITRLDNFKGLHEDIYIGHSRKSFLTFLTSSAPALRDPATAFLTSKINSVYCQYLRVHQVKINKQALCGELSEKLIEELSGGFNEALI